jgi:hypothetical protein
MRLLRKRSIRLLVLLVIPVAGLLWIVWNRPARADMATYVPAESLAFIGSDDLTAIASGMEATEGWQALAAPLNAPRHLIPNQWLISLARWTGIGSIEAVLAARSQIALVFMQPEASANEQTLTIKPHAALILETHTSQRRMRPAIENHVRAFADRVFGQSTLTRKQVNGIDLVDWSSSDGNSHIMAAFIDTTAIMGNDESTVLHCAEVLRGRAQSIANSPQLQQIRARVNSNASLFGFVPKAGVQPIVQAWVLNRPGVTGDQMIYAQLISKTFSNLIDSFGWSSNFDSLGAHDRCVVLLASGVGERLVSSTSPQPISAAVDFSLVPADAISVSTYQIKDISSFWKELGTVVSAHSDVLGAVAARQVLRAVLQPYGIGDADLFFSAIGTRVQVIRLEKDSPAVLAADAFDRQALRKLAEDRLGPSFKTVSVNGTDVLVSSDERWAAAFPETKFLIGPADSVRRCLNAKAESSSMTSVGSFRRARDLVDVSTSAIAINFSNEKSSAISFVELFSPNRRSAFSSNRAAIDQAGGSLPYAVSVTTIRSDVIEWDSRSAFGILGSLFTTFSAEPSR